MRWAWLVVIITACGGSGTSSPPARCTGRCRPDAPAPLALCELCTADTDCASGVCRMYGDGYRKCTTSCAAGGTAPECSAPAEGGCNLMGFCMCPQIQVPMDAGTEPRDAPIAIDAQQ